MKKNGEKTETGKKHPLQSSSAHWHKDIFNNLLAPKAYPFGAAGAGNRMYNSGLLPCRFPIPCRFYFNRKYLQIQDLGIGG
jgi:hypothetical protein